MNESNSSHVFFSSHNSSQCSFIEDNVLIVCSLCIILLCAESSQLNNVLHWFLRDNYLLKFLQESSYHARETAHMVSKLGMYDICSGDNNFAPVINANVKRNPNPNSNPKPNLNPEPKKQSLPSLKLFVVRDIFTGATVAGAIILSDHRS